jgi:hypothetical protein
MAFRSFPGTIPTPKSKLLKRLLSQPWIGPSISLVVLSVSISSLCIAIASFAYNKAGYERQTLRWQAEEDSQIQLQLHIQPDITPDGWRTTYVELYFRPDNPMRFERIEATAPAGVTIKAADSSIVKSGTVEPNSFELSDSFGSTSQGGPRVVFTLLLRTPQTPAADQNSVVQIRARASELSNGKRTVERETRALIPSDAKRLLAR